jgi:hypothetical protein
MSGGPPQRSGAGAEARYGKDSNHSDDPDLELTDPQRSSSTAEDSDLKAEAAEYEGGAAPAAAAAAAPSRRSCKISAEDALAIFHAKASRKRIRSDECTSSALAERYGITVKAVRDIWTGRTWSKVTGQSRHRPFHAPQNAGTDGAQVAQELRVEWHAFSDDVQDASGVLDSKLSFWPNPAAHPEGVIGFHEARRGGRDHWHSAVPMMREHSKAPFQDCAHRLSPSATSGDGAAVETMDGPGCSSDPVFWAEDSSSDDKSDDRSSPPDAPGDDSSSDDKSDDRSSAQDSNSSDNKSSAQDAMAVEQAWSGSNSGSSGSGNGSKALMRLMLGQWSGSSGSGSDSGSGSGSDSSPPVIEANEQVSDSGSCSCSGSGSDEGGSGGVQPFTFGQALHKLSACPLPPDFQMPDGLTGPPDKTAVPDKRLHTYQ